MSNNDSSDLVGLVLLIVAGVIFFIAWTIHKETGLSFDTIATLGRNYLVAALIIGAGRYFRVISFTRDWNWILAALWLASIPALNEWGSGLTKESFRHFVDIIEPKWYAQTIWQLVIAAVLAGSKYAFNYVYELVVK